MLKLKKDGILERSKYEEKEIIDVSEIAYNYLSDNIDFDDNITIKDLFLLIQKNINMFEIIFGNWIKEYTQEILYSLPTDYSSIRGNYGLDHVQLHWSLSHDGKQLDIPQFPQFDGFSVAVEDDQYYKKGEKIIWGLDLTPVQYYIDKPFKLIKKITFYNEKTNEEQEFDTEDFTLFQIILGVIWEISFFGGPSDTKQKKLELEAAIERIQNGEEELIPIEDVFERIKKRLDSIDQNKEL